MNRWIDTVRRAFILALVVSASAAVSQWKPTPRTSTLVLNAAKLIPPIFTSSVAAGPTKVIGDDGKVCTGTPISPNGKLAITLKSMQLVNDKNESKPNPGWGPGTLDFAANSGATVGNFVAGNPIDAGTYTQMNLTMGSSLAVKGSITCIKGGITTTYITNGSSVLTSKDPVGNAADAAESNYSINGGADKSFTMTFPSPITIGAGEQKSIAVFFNNSAALELWDISSITGIATDRKILPGGGGPSKAQ
jgi:hypothetical protein